MTAHATDRNLVRTAVLGAALLLGSFAGFGHAAAEPPIPTIDAGGPGGGGGVALDVDWKLTSNGRTIALTESKEPPGGILAGMHAPPARIPYAESERAVAMNRVSVASQAPQAAGPHIADY